jgi:predicted NBD/HSP70 family sugar kinase
VDELLTRRLVQETGLERSGQAGRPGRMLAVDGSGVGGLGIELNVDYLAVHATDLAGRILVERRVAYDAVGAGPERCLATLGTLTRESLAEMALRGAVPVAVGVAVPALVDVGTGTVVVAPNLGWRDLPLRDRLGKQIEQPLPILVDNDANLAALAEYNFGVAAGTADLVYLTGEVGVGGGVIVGGRLLRGASGFTGEVGHVPLGDPARVCGCGRQGCWETTVGLAALLREAADDDDPVRDPERDLEDRLAEIERRAAAGDERTLAALHGVGVSLGTGAALLINVFNPQVVVLGGYFAVLGRYLVDPMTAELRSRVFGPGLAGARVVRSRLGFTAAVRGGAHVALEQVLADPTLVPADPTRRPPTGRRSP